MARNHPLPDFVDKSAMLAIITLHISPRDNDTFAYDPYWSDLLIAQAVNPAFKAHHAAAVRRAKFGLLFREPHRMTVVEPPSPSRMDILEERVLRIIDILATNSPRSAQHRRYLLDGSSTTAHLDDI